MNATASGGAPIVGFPVINGTNGNVLSVDSGGLLATTNDLSSLKATPTGGSTARTLAARFADRANALDFGADNTGVADSTSALNSLFSYAASNNIQAYIPRGTYKTSAKLNLASNLKLAGDGRGVTNIYCSLPSGSGLVSTPILDLPIGGTNITIRDLTIYGNMNADATLSTVPAYGILFENSGTGNQYSNVLIENVEIYGCYSTGVMSGSNGTGSNIRIIDCDIHDMGTAAQNVSGVVHVGITPPQANGVLIRGCRIWNIGAYSLSTDHAIYCSRAVSQLSILGNYLSGGIQFYSHPYSDITIQGNVIIGVTDAPIILGGTITNFSIIGNAIETSYQYGIGLIDSGCSLGTVVGNSILINSAASSGITVTCATDCAIVGNKIHTTDSSVNHIGINLIDTFAISRLLIADNSIAMAQATGNAHYGVAIAGNTGGGGVTDCTIRGNQIYKCTFGIFLNGTGGTGILRSRIDANRLVACSSGYGIRVQGTSSLTAATIATGNEAYDSTISVASDNGEIARNYANNIIASGTNAKSHGNIIVPVTPYATLSSNSSTPLVTSSLMYLLSNTAPTTITNFANAASGEERVFRATNGNTTIQHGTSIMLKRQANWTMSNGDTLVLQLDSSGAWWEVGDGSVVSLPSSTAIAGGYFLQAPGVWTPLPQPAAQATKSAAYTIANSDGTILGNATAAGFAVTLSAASGAYAGRRFTIKKTDSSANAVTVTPSGTDKIDGAASYSLAAQNKYVVVESDGSANWWVVANN